MAVGRAFLAPSEAVRIEAVRLREEAFAKGDPAAALGPLLNLVQRYPGEEVLQRMAARLFDAIGAREEAVRAWQGIAARFPRSRTAFLGLVRALARQSRAAAGNLIETHIAHGPMSLESALSIAKAWDAVGDAAQTSTAFERMTVLFRQREEAWQAAASWYERQGLYRSATEILRRAAETSPQPDSYVKRLRQIDAVIARLPQRALRYQARGRPRRSTVVLSSLLEELVSARNEAPPQAASPPRSVVMAVNCLGAGGTQRQLVNTALGLQAMRAANPQAPPFDWIRVVAQSCRAQRHDGFFLERLQRAGVPVIEYEDLPICGGHVERSVLRPIVPILRFLPVPMLESLLRLGDALRLWRPEVVQIWQEAMAFETALAALLARVPRIILCLRSMPAIDRPDRYRVEYPMLFQALLAAQNVTFCCNSQFAALRYGEWLGVDPARFAVIANGVAPSPPTGDDRSQALYREFDARTGKSPLTLGVVMRLDENKRAPLWVEAAARILERLPSARFILVGEGRLRRAVMKWTRERGIAHRFLFTGVSRNVGFWLSKMDLFLLLSQQEGLPNALIEAQLGGVPVVITPAGGAPETMVSDVTGILLDPDPSAEEVAARVLDLAADPERRRAMGAAARKRASEAFSPEQMLRHTLALMAGGAVEAQGRDHAALGGR